MATLALPGCFALAPFDPSLLGSADPQQGDDGGGADPGDDPSPRADDPSDDGGNDAPPDDATEDREGQPCEAGQVRGCYPGLAAEVGVGVCRAGQQSCVVEAGAARWGTCEGAVEPSVERCGNGDDEDCNGEADDGCGCTLGATQECFPGEAAQKNVGPCRAGTQACNGVSWGPCEGATAPTDEQCGNRVDDDCDGTVDDGCGHGGGGGGGGGGVCTPGVEEACGGCGRRACGADGQWGACEGSCDPCYRCAGAGFYTADAWCGLEEVDANADGSCPAGTSHDTPECEPCWDCRVSSGFCPDEGCCGDWTSGGVVGAGCTCYGCSGFGMAADQDASRAEAIDATSNGCPWPSGEVDTSCGIYETGCWIVSCGPAGACG